MFFHSKLNVHNFTFYDLKTHQVMNYIWSEVNRELNASNFTSCYINYEYVSGAKSFHEEDYIVEHWVQYSLQCVTEFFSSNMMYSYTINT